MHTAFTWPLRTLRGHEEIACRTAEHHFELQIERELDL